MSRSIPLQNVSVTSSFWTGRQGAIRLGSIPAMYEQMKQTGRWDCMKMQWKPGQPNKPHRFWDSDMAKWLEAACYSLTMHRDPELAKLVEEAVDIVISGQQSDGYLNTYYTVVEPGKRWTNIAWSHEMYDCGHLLEAALAYEDYSGSKRLLDCILKYVEHISKTFGPGEYQKPGYPGHQEIELALLKAYERTGYQYLLDVANFFIEERGQSRHNGHYYDIEAKARGEPPFVGPGNGPRYSYHQADLPIREVKTLKGHSVRAMYWLTAVANLARLKKDDSLVEIVQRLWDGLTEKKMYITGGLGAYGEWEGFGPDYFLPNETGYLETCASIGLILLAYQMLLLDPKNASYANTLELALYNAVLVGISLDGKSFFYDNPLATMGKSTSRADWFEVSCCPPNVARLYQSLGKYIYTIAEQDIIYVHLYISSQMDLTLSSGTTVRIVQETKAPWTGCATFRFNAPKGVTFRIHFRRPLGAQRFTVILDGVHQSGRIATISSGLSTVQIDWVYPVTRIYPHPLNLDNANSVAISRGPFIYCAETIDNPHIDDLRSIRLPDNALLKAVVDQSSFKTWGLEPFILETYEASIISESGSMEYNVKLKLIPVFLWANRGKSDHRVWLPRATHCSTPYTLPEVPSPGP